MATTKEWAESLGICGDDLDPPIDGYFEPCGRRFDEIMPGLGDDIHSFSSTSVMRPPSELLGEDDRANDLYGYALKADRAGELPEDLNLQVLYQRRYAFEWLNGQDWDGVQVDT